MLTLFTMHGSSAVRCFSPFAYKAEALLALSGADYQLEYVGDFSTLPNGKIPVLKDGKKLIADSELIKAYLVEHFSLDIDRTLTAEQQAIAQAFRVMLEERTYWAGVYARFLDPAGEDFVLNEMFGGVPVEVKTEIVKAMRETLRQEMVGHGIGRHSKAQIYAFAQADVEAVLQFMGDKDFFFGNEPTTIDATIASLFANWLAGDFDWALGNFIKTQPQIAEYVKRFERVVFGGK